MNCRDFQLVWEFLGWYAWWIVQWGPALSSWWARGSNTVAVSRICSNPLIRNTGTRMLANIAIKRGLTTLIQLLLSKHGSPHLWIFILRAMLLWETEATDYLSSLLPPRRPFCPRLSSHRRSTPNDATNSHYLPANLRLNCFTCSSRLFPGSLLPLATDHSRFVYACFN